MNIDNSVYLAFDTSYEHGAVVLFRGDEILFEKRLEQRFAHGKLICDAIRNATIVDNEIKGVFCGLGPGSFVGVRVALATALGFCFGRQIPLMGFCSHDALALTVARAQNFSLFMKASGDLGYFTHYDVMRESNMAASPPRVVAKHDLPTLLVEGDVVFTDYPCGLSSIELRDHHVERIAGPSPHAIARAARLRMRDGFVDESTFIKPNYVKAPSVSLPKAG